VSAELKQLIAEHTIASCNLEAPVVSGGAPIEKVGPHLIQSADALAQIKAAGFTMINAANNHIADYGKAGISATIEACEDFDLIGIGTTFDDTYALKLKIVDGRRFGFLSFSEWGFGIADAETGGYAWVNHPAVNTLVRSARAQVDILIIQVHAGVEVIDIPLPEWRARYRELIDLGATVVIAHHPHEVQGMENYGRGKIFYSVGNFSLVTNPAAVPGSHGAILSLTFEQSSLTDWQLLPVSCTDGTVDFDHRPGALAHLESLHQKLEAPYAALVDVIVVRLWEERYRHFYQRSLGGFRSLRGFTKTILNVTTGESIDYNLLSHNLNIESHRFVAERAAKLLSKSN